MRRNQVMISVLLGLGGLAAWLWFTKSGRDAAASAGDVIDTGVRYVESLMRGERNNNPGNIRISSNAWQGKIDPSGDPSFEQFDTPENGIRALAVLVKNYYTKYGLNTVNQIISRWAPSTENNTDSYVSSVARDMGVTADQPISLTDQSTLFNLVKAIIKHENGRIGYTDSQILTGVQRAFT